MAKRHRLRKLGPRVLARVVKDAFVRKVSSDLPQMKQNYVTNVRQFIANAEAKISALTRLAATYLAMKEINYPVEMKRIYDRIISEYTPRAQRVAEEILARARVVV